MIRDGLPRYFLGLTGLYNPEYAINIKRSTFIFRVATIKEIMEKMGVRGGMALTSMYRVRINKGSERLNSALEDYDWFPEWTRDQQFIELMCDEAQLPNIQAQTGLMTGRHLGEGSYQYPHTRVYSDLSMSFICDAAMTQLKFFSSWHDFIFGSRDSIADGFRPQRTKVESAEELLGQGGNPMNSVVRAKYPEKYVCDIRVMKVDQGPKADRASIMYILRDAYPYSIDTIPLAYGTSQLTKCTVNFYYKKHDIIYNAALKNEATFDTSVAPPRG